MSRSDSRTGSAEHASCCGLQVSPSCSCCPCAAIKMFRRRKKKRRPEISSPQDFQHRVHTSFDTNTGRYVGLPPQWQSVIDNLKRPRPLVDPSRITEVTLTKVSGRMRRRRRRSSWDPFVTLKVVSPPITSLSLKSGRVWSAQLVWRSAVPSPTCQWLLHWCVFRVCVAGG